MIERLIQVVLFALALGFAAAGAFSADEDMANVLYFGAWCAALLLIFALAIRIPLYLRMPASGLWNAGIVIAAFGIVLLANIALYRHDTHFDVTLSGRFTAPPELEAVARSLKTDVHLTYFYNEQDDDARTAKEVLAAIAHKRPHFVFRALDLDKEVVVARDYGVQVYNTVVVEAEGHRAEVPNTVDLREVAFAIQRVLSNKNPIVCFSVGHGEPYEAVEKTHWHLSHVETLQARDVPGGGDVIEGPPAGVQRLKLALERIGYVDRALPAPIVAPVPSDCAVVVDLGPRRAYTPEEVNVLQNYLARGGRLLLMYDPDFPVSPELGTLLRKIGLEVGDGVVIDPVNHYETEEDKVAVPYYPPHPITQDLALTVFPGARPLRLAEHIPGITATVLASTSKDSYLRAINGARMGQTEGPAALVIAEQGQLPGEAGKPFRLVLMGNASIATNAFFPYVSNGDLVVASIRWLAEDTNGPRLKPLTYSLPELRLTHHEMQTTFLVLVVFLPLVVALLGGVVWWRRR